MKFYIFLLLLFTNSLVFAQSEDREDPDIIIHYSNDMHVVLAGYKKSSNDSVHSKFNNITVDSIVSNYQIQFEFNPYLHDFPYIENHITLDSASFAELLIKSKQIMIIIQYGYAGSRNYPQLTEKYGVSYHAGGCVYRPDEIGHPYYKYMRRLLQIRNGVGWEARYNLDVKQLKK